MFDWIRAVGILHQNHHRLVTVDGLVRLDRYTVLSVWTAWAPPWMYGWAPPWICERIYFMIYIQDYARGPDLTIIGKKDNNYLL